MRDGGNMRTFGIVIVESGNDDGLRDVPVHRREVSVMNVPSGADINLIIGNYGNDHVAGWGRVENHLIGVVGRTCLVDIGGIACFGNC